MGIGYLRRTGVEFEQVFAADAERLAFEFSLFLREIEDGYRVDSCGWDWETEFSAIQAGESASVRVLAARGFQPRRRGETAANGL